MMHGYLAFGAANEQIAVPALAQPTAVAAAAAELTETSGVVISLHSEIAHLQQTVLDGEARVGVVNFPAALAGYVRWSPASEKATASATPKEYSSSIPLLMPKPPSAVPYGKPEPSFEVSAAAWFTAGAAHHTVMAIAVGFNAFTEFTDIARTKLLLIDENTDLRTFH